MKPSPSLVTSAGCMALPPSSRSPRGYLPRLTPEAYRGLAAVFWTHTIRHRGTGWLDDAWHSTFREIVLHAAVREHVFCPIYTLMPDHLHLVWMGVNAASDQRRATAFLRLNLEPRLKPHDWQHQAYDHVLRDEERRRNAFGATCAYIAENPVRAGLVAEAAAWPYTGCIVPGFPELHPLTPGFWDVFWKIYNAAVTRGAIGKLETKTQSKNTAS